MEETRLQQAMENFMKKPLLILAAIAIIPTLAHAAASSSAAASAPATGFRPVTPATPQSPAAPQEPGRPTLNTVVRGGTNAFTPAGATNLFGTNQFGTNALSANLFPLLTSLQTDIQQTLPALAALTTGFSVTNAAATSESLTGALSTISAAAVAVPGVAAQPPPANFGKNLGANFSTRSSGNFGQNLSTSVGATPAPNVANSFVTPTPTGVTNLPGQPPGVLLNT